jgi:hypothetical protein
MLDRVSTLPVGEVQIHDEKGDVEEINDSGRIIQGTGVDQDVFRYVLELDFMSSIFTKITRMRSERETDIGSSSISV